jgi:glycerol kinase
MLRSADRSARRRRRPQRPADAVPGRPAGRAGGPSKVTETTALGAAYLAGLAVGFWDTQEEIAAQWRCGRRFEPAGGADQRADLLSTWARAVERSKSWTD